MDRGLGLLKEAGQHEDIKNPGGKLTWLSQKIAREYGISLNCRRLSKPERLQIGVNSIRIEDVHFLGSVDVW